MADLLIHLFLCFLAAGLIAPLSRFVKDANAQLLDLESSAEPR